MTPQEQARAALTAISQAVAVNANPRMNDRSTVQNAVSSILAALDQMAGDTRRLDWLNEEIVNVIDLDDGRIIDVRGLDVRAAIDAAMQSYPAPAEPAQQRIQLTKEQWIDRYGGQELLDRERLDVVPCTDCDDHICHGWRVQPKSAEPAQQQEPPLDSRIGELCPLCACDGMAYCPHHGQQEPLSEPLPPEVDLGWLEQLETAVSNNWTLERGNVGATHPLFISDGFGDGWRAPDDDTTMLVHALRNAAPALIAWAKRGMERK